MTLANVCYIDIVQQSTSSDGIDDFYRELGSRIRRARRGQLTQQELANRIGLSRAAVANIELGRQRVASHMLPRFAEALGLEPHDLLPETLAPGRDEEVSGDLSRLRPRDQQTVLRVMTLARRERASNA
jgi:transcriptional regulator with XRE-family HTH domain